LSDRETEATGSDKRVLSALCEYLVLRRERLDDERMDALYASTLEMVVDKAVPQSVNLPLPVNVTSVGDSDLEADSDPDSPYPLSPEDLSLLRKQRSEAVSLLESNPDLYALELAERLTGTPVVVDGYPNPIFDLIVKTEAPAAITVEGVRRAHSDAAELASDLKGRRKRSVASIIGRAKLTAEQADQLKVV